MPLWRYFCEGAPLEDEEVGYCMGKKIRFITFFENKQ